MAERTSLKSKVEAITSRESRTSASLNASQPLSLAGSAARAKLKISLHCLRKAALSEVDI